MKMGFNHRDKRVERIKYDRSLSEKDCWVLDLVLEDGEDEGKGESPKYLSSKTGQEWSSCTKSFILL